MRRDRPGRRKRRGGGQSFWIRFEPPATRNRATCTAPSHEASRTAAGGTWRNSTSIADARSTVITATPLARLFANTLCGFESARIESKRPTSEPRPSAESVGFESTVACVISWTEAELMPATTNSTAAGTAEGASKSTWSSLA